jgi:hypothetical protein
MATKTANAKTSKGQHGRGTEPGSALACQSSIASGVNVPSEGQAVYWADRFAFKFWLACFALMALMVAYDAIAGVWRWLGSN